MLSLLLEAVLRRVPREYRRLGLLIDLWMLFLQLLDSVFDFFFHMFDLLPFLTSLLVVWLINGLLSF